MLMATWLANDCDDKRKLHDSQKTQMIKSFRKTLQAELIFIGLVFRTHLLMEDSQQKQMDDGLVLFAATVAQSKLSDVIRFLVSFHELICIRKTKGHSGNFPFVNNNYITMDCGQKLWTMDWHCSVRYHNKY